MATSKLPLDETLGQFLDMAFVLLGFLILKQHRWIWVCYLNTKLSLREPQYVSKWLICIKAKYLQYLNAVI